jgi:hypothetical protein
MQGVGHVLTEEVLEEPSSGAALSSSTWSYKPPGIAELPRVRAAAWHSTTGVSKCCMRAGSRSAECCRAHVAAAHVHWMPAVCGMAGASC